MNYRSEIDGLRALAVMPVILYHAGFEVFSGGFIGVDIFFVISGYLITSILIEEIKNHRFSIINFYYRRARRILPALFFIMIVCIPFAWLWMLPSEMKLFSQSLVAVSFFVSNIFFWENKTDYFGGVAEHNPLLHTWSLAIEEQYYLFFPVFLIIFWKIGRNKLFYLISIIAISSILLNEWAIRNNQLTANFYFIFTRAWELLAGSIAALLIEKRGVSKNGLMSLLGLISILFAIFTFNQNTPIPSTYALFPVLGTFFIIIFTTKETLVFKLLSKKIIVFIGLISYSAYLWHQPLFAFSKIRLLENPSIYITGTLSLITLPLGYFTWRYIEQPFRKDVITNKRMIFLLSFLFMLFFLIFGLISAQKNGFASRFEFIEPDSPIKNNKCHGDEADINKCLKRETDKINIFVLGDSHGSQTYTAIKNNINLKELFEINYVSKKTPKNFPYSFFKFEFKETANDETIDILLKNLKKNDYLIISIFADRISKDSEKKSLFYNNMENFLKVIEKKNINLIFQLDNPLLPSSKWIYCYNEYQKKQISSCGLSKSNYQEFLIDSKNIYTKLCDKREWCEVLPISNLYFKEKNWFDPMENWSFVDNNHLSKYELDRLGVLYLKYLRGANQ